MLIFLLKNVKSLLNAKAPNFFQQKRPYFIVRNVENIMPLTTLFYANGSKISKEKSCTPSLCDI